MKLKWFFIICGISFALVVVVLKATETKYIPENMVGRWETSSSKYKNRFLELSRFSVIFATGEETIEVNSVTRVDIQDVEGRPLYMIRYENQEGEPGSIGLYWEPSGDGMLQLKNQKKMVWKRVIEVF